MESQRGQIKRGQVLNKSDFLFRVVTEFKHEDVNQLIMLKKCLRILTKQDSFQSCYSLCMFKHIYNVVIIQYLLNILSNNYIDLTG